MRTGILKLKNVAINLNGADMQALLKKVPGALRAATVEAGFLIPDDCRRIWPKSFNGDLDRAAESLRNAGFKSARVEKDWAV